MSPFVQTEAHMCKWQWVFRTHVSTARKSNINMLCLMSVYDHIDDMY